MMGTYVVDMMFVLLKKCLVVFVIFGILGIASEMGNMKDNRKFR